jgi:hypothetical protein
MLSVFFIPKTATTSGTGADVKNATLPSTSTPPANTNTVPLNTNPGQQAPTPNK